MSSMITFALLAIEHPQNNGSSKRFCLVHEIDDRGWWLPGGGVDDGETAAQGGIREALEEAGVCNIEGGIEGLRLLRVEQTDTRFRWILHCRAGSDSIKSVADKESKGARWVTLDECRAIDEGRLQGVENCWLRGEEPIKWFEYLSAGQPSFPVSRFLQAQTHKGSRDFHGRASYFTDCEGCIVVFRKGSGKVVALRQESGALRLPSTALAPQTPELQRLLRDKQLSPAVDVLASFICAPVPNGICGIQMMQRADGTATFAVVFGVEDHVEEKDASRIASEIDSDVTHSALVWLDVESLTDIFERESAVRLRQKQIMPRSVLVHNMGHYPKLPGCDVLP